MHPIVSLYKSTKVLRRSLGLGSTFPLVYSVSALVSKERNLLKDTEYGYLDAKSAEDQIRVVASDKGSPY